MSRRNQHSRAAGRDGIAELGCRCRPYHRPERSALTCFARVFEFSARSPAARHCHSAGDAFKSSRTCSRARSAAALTCSCHSRSFTRAVSHSAGRKLGDYLAYQPHKTRTTFVEIPPSSLLSVACRKSLLTRRLSRLNPCRTAGRACSSRAGKRRSTGAAMTANGAARYAVLLHLGESKSVTGGPTNPEWPMTLRSNGLRRIICVGAARNSIDWLLEQAAIA